MSSPLMSSPPRLRFAPSPTGMFHVGSARTALYNWLYTQRLGGTFILRIEDTDEARNRPEWTEAILEAMSWIGLDWDEGPYFQMDNSVLHAAAGQRLYDEGKAYYCDCTADIVKDRTQANATPGYDNFCRDRVLGPGPGRALRFRIPPGATTVHDLVRGDVAFDHAHIEDFVVVRSTGVPMFVLANLVDDIDQRVTHVVRGEELLPNTPKQLLLWQSLSDHPAPTYAHLPVIVNEKRKKLSKRRDKVSLEMYRDEGYLPEAMRNYLALLGWAPRGDREIVPIEEMVGEFRFEDVNKSSAFFDVAKLTYINGEYIRALCTEEFISRCEPFLAGGGRGHWPPERFNAEVFATMASLVQERVARLDEVPPMVDFLFVDNVIFDETALKVMAQTTSSAILDGVLEGYVDCEWKAAVLHEITLAVGEQHGLKLGKAQAPVRLAVTGKKVGPPLFESMEVLGREVTLARLRRLRTLAAEAAEAAEAVAGEQGAG